MDTFKRLELLMRLSELPADTIIGAYEVSVMLDLSEITIRQRRSEIVPSPISGLRVLRWRIGDVRAAIRNSKTSSVREKAPPTRKSYRETNSSPNHLPATPKAPVDSKPLYGVRAMVERIGINSDRNRPQFASTAQKSESITPGEEHPE